MVTNSKMLNFLRVENVPVLIVKDESDIQNTPRNPFPTCFNPSLQEQLSNELVKPN